MVFWFSLTLFLMLLPIIVRIRCVFASLLLFRLRLLFCFLHFIRFIVSFRSCCKFFILHDTNTHKLTYLHTQELKRVCVCVFMLMFIVFTPFTIRITYLFISLYSHFVVVRFAHIQHTHTHNASKITNLQKQNAQSSFNSNVITIDS